MSDISDDLCLAITICVSVGLPWLLGSSYSSLPLLVKASHMKVLINRSPETLGGCAGREKPAFILTTSFSSFPPGPATLGGCCGPGSSVTVKVLVLKVFPPWPQPWPGFLLGVDLCLSSPCPLPLFGCLPLNHLCLFCGLPKEGE